MTAYKLLILSCLLGISSCNAKETSAKTHTLTKSVLMDKIKGGWAGQVIGCTYGGPTEFKWNGTMIGEDILIPWDDSRMEWYYKNSPGLYDDVYMDLTFVEVFDKYGLDAPDSLHAKTFANAGYPLWHANQAARYNILNGIMPPASGHWKNNPHADDIDFQIEADFAGLMTPGMANSAAEIGWRIGHIMNYGDGVYGGVYVAAMYALAFVHDDIEFIVEEALKTIPSESEYYQCIMDVIKCYREDPDDWKKAWFEAQKKWTSDRGCPEGVFRPYNIDAKINGAYIAIGLLFGKGDYGATIDISTRCGYDSDCNPANAAGILGTMIGYNNIPDYWKQGIDKVENLDFAHTKMSLNHVYETGFRHALEVINRNGGKINGEDVKIKYQTPESVPFEQSFEGLYPVARRTVGVQLTSIRKEVTFDVEGSGFVLIGRGVKANNLKDEILETEVFIDGNLFEVAKIPSNGRIRRHDVTWNYDLEEGKHTVTLKVKHVPEGYRIETQDVLVYSRNKPGKVVYY